MCEEERVWFASRVATAICPHPEMKRAVKPYLDLWLQPSGAFISGAGAGHTGEKPGQRGRSALVTNAGKLGVHSVRGQGTNVMYHTRDRAETPSAMIRSRSERRAASGRPSP